MGDEENCSNFKKVVNGSAKDVISLKKTHHEPWVSEGYRVLSKKKNTTESAG